MHLDVKFTDVAQPVGVAVVFQAVYRFLLRSAVNLMPHISDLDCLRATKRLRYSQCVALDGAPGTIINGCLAIFAPLPKYNSISACHRNTSLRSGGGGYCAYSEKKGSGSAISNYRPIYHLYYFSGVFEFTVYYHMSHFSNINLLCTITCHII